MGKKSEENENGIGGRIVRGREKGLESGRRNKSGRWFLGWKGREGKGKGGRKAKGKNGGGIGAGLLRGREREVGWVREWTKEYLMF
jgi:hypothetical protein